MPTGTTWPCWSWAARSPIATTSCPSVCRRRAKITREPSASWPAGAKRTPLLVSSAVWSLESSFRSVFFTTRTGVTRLNFRGPLWGLARRIHYPIERSNDECFVLCVFRAGKTGTNLLQKVYVPILNNRMCYVWHELKDIILELHDEMFCAGHEHGKMDACLVSITSTWLHGRSKPIFTVWPRLFTARRAIRAARSSSTTEAAGSSWASRRRDSAARSTTSRASTTKSARRSIGLWRTSSTDAVPQFTRQSQRKRKRDIMKMKFIIGHVILFFAHLTFQTFLRVFLNVLFDFIYEVSGHEINLQ